MDLELIRTLTLSQTKNLVNVDSQTYRARYLGLSLSVCFSPGQKVSKHSLFEMFKDGRYSPPQNAVFTWYSSTSAAEHTCILIHQRASDTDEISYGAVSGENMDSLLQSFMSFRIIFIVIKGMLNYYVTILSWTNFSHISNLNS
jgi:hypothetical protein